MQVNTRLGESRLSNAVSGDKRLSVLQKLERFLSREHPVVRGVAVVLGMFVIGVSGVVSLRVTSSEIDEGRTYTLAESRQRSAALVERIKNDPGMPPEAKAVALRYLQPVPPSPSPR
jgi:hypothetical protein